jgi:hypothetical protein
MADGFNPLTLQSITTIEGLNELNRMLMSLYDNMAGDGVNTKVLTGTGVPSIAAGNGSLYLRTDTGKLYVRENGSWAVK